MNEIIIASRNKGKINEFKQLFTEVNIQVRSLFELKNIDISDIEETGTTFHENAQIKAKTTASILNKPVIADDSGLIVDAINGEPGIYSARYADEQTNDVKNYEKVLYKLNEVERAARTARFIAVLALVIPGYETIYFEGTCEGEIAFSPIGTNGFGYDPIFIPNGYNKTMAQLSEEEKNKISHRSKAMKKFNAWIRKNIM